MIYKEEKYRGFPITYHKSKNNIITSNVSGFGSKICSGKTKSDVSKRTKRFLDMYIKRKKGGQA